jgi:hypothetical protein
MQQPQSQNKMPDIKKEEKNGLMAQKLEGISKKLDVWAKGKRDFKEFVKLIEEHIQIEDKMGKKFEKGERVTSEELDVSVNLSKKFSDIVKADKNLGSKLKSIGYSELYFSRRAFKRIDFFNNQEHSVKAKEIEKLRDQLKQDISQTKDENKITKQKELLKTALLELSALEELCKQSKDNYEGIEINASKVIAEEWRANALKHSQDTEVKWQEVVKKNVEIQKSSQEVIVKANEITGKGYANTNMQRVMIFAALKSPAQAALDKVKKETIEKLEKMDKKLEDEKKEAENIKDNETKVKELNKIVEKHDEIIKEKIMIDSILADLALQNQLNYISTSKAA